MANLSQEVEAIQSMIQRHSNQLTNVVDQLRAMTEGMRRIQEDWMADQAERVSDKEGLKYLILDLSARYGGSEYVNEPLLQIAPPPPPYHRPSLQGSQRECWLI